MGMSTLKEEVNHLTTNHFNHNFHKKKWLNGYSGYKTDQSSSKRNKAGYTAELARQQADYLVRKLVDPKNYYFYLKCAWNLTDAYLDRLLGIALTKTNSKLYFAKAAAREMANNA